MVGGAEASRGVGLSFTFLYNSVRFNCFFSLGLVAGSCLGSQMNFEPVFPKTLKSESFKRCLIPKNVKIGPAKILGEVFMFLRKTLNFKFFSMFSVLALRRCNRAETTWSSES